MKALDPVDSLNGLGASARKELAEHGIRTVADLVWTAPVGWDDLRSPAGITAGSSGHVVCRGIVASASIVPLRGRRGLRVVLRDVTDETCKMQALWFYLAQNIRAVAQPGATVLAIGRVDEGRMIQPELVLDVPEARTLRARYPRFGPSNGALRRGIAQALAEVDAAPDPVPSEIAAREKMPAADTALEGMHNGGQGGAFRERLAWTEAFARAWDRLIIEEDKSFAPALPMPKRRLKLDFELTADQKKAVAEIAEDLTQTTPMRRLLLGDVGTGKTAVALAAIAQCIAAKRQAMVLAPTSVLAEQYAAAMKPLDGASVAFVTAATLDRGRIDADVVVGTHALLGESVELPRLALVVVDEQQRLGVAQRLALVRKGVRPHLLTLSATPIPRTLALALRGEIATSTLRQMPAGRLPITTEIVPKTELLEVIERARGAGRVFWVVPRIDDDESNIEERAKSLGAGVVHGRLKPEEKHAAIAAFRSGKKPILVGTTVVEVGLDVPEAKLIVIEDADRFGLAQLHQLRGRVGRAPRTKPDTCILLHRVPLGSVAQARLEAAAKLTTGEEIALADLALRGAGDPDGTRQHGTVDAIEPNATYDWLSSIETDARRLRAEDPKLKKHPLLAAMVERARRSLALREETG